MWSTILLSLFAIIFLQLFDTSHSQDENSQSENENPEYSSHRAEPCGPQMLTNPDLCCKVPRLIGVETLRSCIGGFGGGMGGGMSPKIIKSLGKERATVAENEGGEALKLSMEKGPMCTAECILRSQGFLNDNGDLELEKMKEKLIEGASGDWKSVIEAAFTNCSTDLQSKSMILPSTGDGCKAESTVIMSCLRRFLVLECPESARSANGDGSCDKKREFLASCDPFSLTKEAIEGKFPEFIRQHLGNMMGLTNPKPGQKRRRYGLIGQRGGIWDLERNTKLPDLMMG